MEGTYLSLRDLLGDVCRSTPATQLLIGAWLLRSLVNGRSRPLDFQTTQMAIAVKNQTQLISHPDEITHRAQEDVPLPMYANYV